LRLLLTRPVADAARSAAALRARGHDVVLAPLIRIEPVPADVGSGASGPWAAVLITSANALAGVRVGELTSVPLIAVGDHSAAAARAAGFADVSSASGAVGDLAALVREKKFLPDQRLLYLSGADKAGNLAAELEATGLTVETRVVYRAAALATLPEPAGADLLAGRIDGVLHYSRRTAEAYLAAAVNLGPAALSPVHFCLSGQIAEPLATAGATKIRVAMRPSEASLLQLVESA